MSDRKEKFVNFNRNHIIEVSEKLFTEYGYDKVTTEQIKDAAGCSKSTLYNYFKNKEQIFNGIVLKGLESMADFITEALINAKDGFGEYFVPELSNNDISLDCKNRLIVENMFYALCFAVSNFQAKYPLRFEGVAGNVDISVEGESIVILKRIFDAGEKINTIIGDFLTEAVKAGVFRADLKLPETIFSFWGALLGVVRIGGQDDAVIQKRMNVSKNMFLRYSFELLFNSME